MQYKTYLHVKKYLYIQFSNYITDIIKQMTIKNQIKALALNLYKPMFLLVVVVLLHSCKCPTDIDTPRKIEPDNAAKVLFVNCHTDEDVQILSDDVVVETNLANGNYTEGYLSVIAGNELIHFETAGTGEKLLNVPSNLRKDGLYTAVFMNVDNYCAMEIMSDDETVSDKPLIRFVNATNKRIDVVVEELGINQNLVFSKSTGLIEAPIGEYQIILYENTNVLLKQAITIDGSENKTLVIHNVDGAIEMLYIGYEI